MTKKESKQSLRTIWSALVKAHKAIDKEVTNMEIRMMTEYEMATDEEFKIACRILGILTGQMEEIRNKFKK